MDSSFPSLDDPTPLCPEACVLCDCHSGPGQLGKQCYPSELGSSYSPVLEFGLFHMLCYVHGNITISEHPKDALTT